VLISASPPCWLRVTMSSATTLPPLTAQLFLDFRSLIFLTDRGSPQKSVSSCGNVPRNIIRTPNVSHTFTSTLQEWAAAHQQWVRTVLQQLTPTVPPWLLFLLKPRKPPWLIRLSQKRSSKWGNAPTSGEGAGNLKGSRSPCKSEHTFLLELHSVSLLTHLA